MIVLRNYSNLQVSERNYFRTGITQLHRRIDKIDSSSEKICEIDRIINWENELLVYGSTL